MNIIRPLSEVCYLEKNFPDYVLVHRYDYALIFDDRLNSACMLPSFLQLMKATSMQPYFAIFKFDHWWEGENWSPATTVQLHFDTPKEDARQLLRSPGSILTIDDEHVPWGMYTDNSDWILFTPIPHEIQVLFYNESCKDIVDSWLAGLEELDMCIYSVVECNDFMREVLRTPFHNRIAFMKNYFNYDVPETEDPVPDDVFRLSNIQNPISSQVSILNQTYWHSFWRSILKLFHS